MTEIKVLKVVTLGKDQYCITEGNVMEGTVLYRKMGSNQKPYEVGRSQEGNILCNCKGFHYNEHCKHADDFEKLAPDLPSTSTQVIGKPEDEFIEEGRIAREELEPAVEAVLEAFVGEGVSIEAAGSWRRAKASVHDLDFVTTATPAAIIRVCGEGLETSAAGSKVIRFTTEYAENKNVQIDFSLVETWNWGAGLLYLTGDKRMNIFMRVRAKFRGMKLSRNGLVVRATDELLAAKTEQEIFHKLGMDFVPPSCRENEEWKGYIRD